MEKVNVSHNDVSMLLNAVSNKEYMTKAEALLEEQLESVSQRGDSSHHKYSLLDGSRYMVYRVGDFESKSYSVRYCNVMQHFMRTCRDICGVPQ
jgi:predicted DNA-binding ArsR family transcriptional regulator